MFEKSFRVQFLREQIDSCGNPQYCFEAKLHNCECLHILFSLGKSGYVTSANQDFRELPKDLRQELIHSAWKYLS